MRYPLLLLLMLAACAKPAPRAPEAKRDPAVAAALADPIMTDTDLAIQSDGDPDPAGSMPIPENAMESRAGQ